MGATASLTGTVMSTVGKVYSGIQKNKADQQSAGLLEQEAGQSVASGIQGMIQDQRKATYVASNARARSVAGGLASTSPSVINNVGLIQGQGEYNALTSLYQGRDRASELNTRAAGMIDEGSGAQTAGWVGGISTVLSGGASFYQKYGSPFNVAAGSQNGS